MPRSNGPVGLTGSAPQIEAFTALGLALAVGLAAVAALGWAPSHRSPITIQDAEDEGIPPEFDALLLEGHLSSPYFIATLTVRGVVQPNRYVVGILVQDRGQQGETYVYSLDYALGREGNYGIPTILDGNSLSFLFPLDRLGAEAYIVGLDAAVFGVEGEAFYEDYVVERPREELQIQRILPLPLDPLLLVVVAMVIMVLTVIVPGRVSRAR